MEKYQVVLDIIMCCMWALTYSLAFIGTLKYKFPLISPITHVIIAPFEFAVLYDFIITKAFGFDYVCFTYLYWSLIEIAIIILIIKLGFIKRKYVIPYICAIIIITFIMCYFVSHPEQMFYFSYINTFIGEIFWLWHITKKDYPIKPLVILIFLIKYFGDSIAVLIYFGNGSWIVNSICALLPMLDFAFIVFYFQRKLDIN